MLSNKLSIIIFMFLLQNASEIRFASGGSNEIRGEAVFLCEQRGDACPCVCLCTVPLQLSGTLIFFFLFILVLIFIFLPGDFPQLWIN